MVYAGQHSSRRFGMDDLLGWGLKICVAVALLVHSNTHGLGGRLSAFHLSFFAVFGLYIITLLVPNTRSYEPTAIRRSFMIFGLTVAFSWIVNLGHFEDVNRHLQLSGGTGAAWKVVLLGLIGVVVLVGGYSLGIRFANTERTTRGVLWMLVLAATVNGLVNLISWFLETGGRVGRYNFIPPLTHSQGISIRLSIIGFICALPLFELYRQRRLKRLLTLVCMILLVGSIPIILARQPLLEFLVLVLLYFVLKTPFAKSGRGLRTVAGIVLIFAMMLGMLQVFSGAEEEMKRSYKGLQDEQADDISGRVGQWEAAWQMYKQNPVLGVGYGFYGSRNTVAYKTVAGRQVFVASAHNGLASYFSELGTLGLLAVGYLFFVILRLLWRSWRMRSEIFMHNVVTSVLAIVLVELISQLMANSTLIPPPTESGSVQIAFVYWMLIGMAVSVGLRRNLGKETPQNARRT